MQMKSSKIPIVLTAGLLTAALVLSDGHIPPSSVGHPWLGQVFRDRLVGI